MDKVNLRSARTLADLLKLHRETSAAFSASLDRHDDPMHPVVYALCREQKHLLREIVVAPTASIEEAREKASYLLLEVHDGAEVVEENEWTADLLQSLSATPKIPAEPDVDPLLVLLNTYRGTAGWYDCRRWPNQEAADAAFQEHLAPLLEQMKTPPAARTRYGAIAALRFATEDLKEAGVSLDGFPQPLLAAALAFFDREAVEAGALEEDAPLLALGDQLEALWMAEAALNVPDALTDDEADVVTGRTAAVVDRIRAMPCRSIEGVRVKLRAFAWFDQGAVSDPTPDVALIKSLFEDLGVSTAPAWRAA